MIRTSHLTTEEAADAADELQRQVEALLQGHSNEEVMCVCGTILSQATADLSASPQQGCDAIDRFAAAMKDDIRQNWHLVAARRKRA